MCCFKFGVAPSSPCRVKCLQKCHLDKREKALMKRAQESIKSMIEGHSEVALPAPDNETEESAATSSGEGMLPFAQSPSVQTPSSDLIVFQLSPSFSPQPNSHQKPSKRRMLPSMLCRWTSPRVPPMPSIPMTLSIPRTGRRLPFALR